MNQSPDNKRVKIELDDFDRKFLAEAAVHGISPARAIRARYTSLLQDRVGDGGLVRFPSAGRKGWTEVRIAQTYLAPLVEKLASHGLEQTAGHGLNELSRQSASNFLRQGFLAIDYHTRPRLAFEPNEGVDAAMDGLALKEAVREHWTAHREQIKRAVEAGLNRAIERDFDRQARQNIFRAALADVLLTGGEPGRSSDTLKLTHMRWVSSRAATVATMEMRRRYGKDWRRGQTHLCELHVKGT
jgi:hypothetical protein